MRRKILLIALTIALAAALVGGATMAFFSYKVVVEDNVFTAGTVTIEAGQEVVYGDNMDNVNPGDAFKKCIPIENTGTKNIRLSMLSEFEFDIDDIDWVTIEANWEELCFSKDHGVDGFEDFKGKVLDALTNGDVTNPADAVGGPDGPFDGEGNLVIPIMVAPTATGDWIMKDVHGKYVFFYDGILEPGDDTTICIIVVFDGPWMGNLWQGATFTMVGTFEAIQESNDAPQTVWGEDTWDNYETIIDIDEPRDQLREDFSEKYTNYFYDGYDFKYAHLCELNGDPPNGDPPGEETAWGGNYEGEGSAWWFYFDMSGPSSQTIWAGQEHDAGEVSVTVIPNGTHVTIKIGFDENWELQDVDEAVKVGGYATEDDLPESRPTLGAGDPNRIYAGNELEFVVPYYQYYAIKLDVQH